MEVRCMQIAVYRCEGRCCGAEASRSRFLLLLLLFLLHNITGAKPWLMNHTITRTAMCSSGLISVVICECECECDFALVLVVSDLRFVIAMMDT